MPRKPTHVVRFGPLNVVQSSRLQTYFLDLARREDMSTQAIQTGGWLFKRAFNVQIFEEVDFTVNNFLRMLCQELLEGGHTDEAQALRSAVVTDWDGNRLQVDIP